MYVLLEAVIHGKGVFRVFSALFAIFRVIASRRKHANLIPFHPLPGITIALYTQFWSFH